MEHPSAEPTLARLKGFQRAAVETAFERLYTAPDSTRRFLVADEVGLGKTLIARGIIAKAVEHLWNDVERIDVVYLCSNARIAKQNIRRLNPFPGLSIAEADRITMLPVKLGALAHDRLNFVAFTPGTSLDLKSSEGQRRERALLFWLLHGHWHHGDNGARNLLDGAVKRRDRWHQLVDDFPATNHIAPKVQRRILEALESAGASGTTTGKGGLRVRFQALCARFERARPPWSGVLREEQRELVGELRTHVARACIDLLEPDLVILDEFQRFNDLLDPRTDSEAAQLARRLFEWSDESAEARVLLLSATPYKMYTLTHEADEDDHYADFLRTVDFLEPDHTRQAQLRRHLGDYRRELYSLGAGGGERLHEVKASIELALRRVISRTERLGAGGARDGMLKAVSVPGVALEPRDVLDFVYLQRIADCLEQRSVVEYWKSAPYLLNFMEDYGLKRQLEAELTRRRPDAELVECLAAADGLLLDARGLRDYEAVAPANGRLRALADDLFKSGLWRCLWLPPSRPNYALGGPFAEASSHSAGTTKRLVFSAWTVVPKVIAALLSYELERRSFHAFGGEVENTSEARKKRAPLLRFARSEGRLSGMPVLALAYPSPALARLGDPLDVAGRFGENTAQDDLVDVVAARIETDLAPILAQHASEQGGPDDDSWYWQAPILLDRAADKAGTEAWWSEDALAARWTAAGDDDGDGGRLWTEHVEEGVRVALGDHTRLGRPPADLVTTLARLAIAGPAVCALRSFERVLDTSDEDAVRVRLAAGRIGFAFRSLFNRPEAMALLRAGRRDTPYWRLVLGHGLDGDIDAVLTEHIHVLRDLQGLFDALPGDAAERLARVVEETLSIRASSQPYDVVQALGDDGQVELNKNVRNLRGHVAMRFSTDKSEDEAGGVRADTVRDAFNSPFWPFVLTTTSVGQEGLDFHAWCHAVVHWNLPSNPVDLEQREGRIHRFKGHAIRKNVARRHGAALNIKAGEDPWSLMFDQAVADVADDARGLVPWWVYPLEGGASIERHVPMLPLSREQSKLEALRKSLAVYRMVFGQPRQDDLLAYLMEHVSREDIEQKMAGMRMDLSPR